MKQGLTLLVILIAGAALTLWLVGNNKSSSDSPKNTEIVDSSTTKNNGVSSYKNGSYDASATYFSPGGEDQITIEVTILNNTITSLNIIKKPGNPTSAGYQEDFSEDIDSKVVSKDVDSIFVSRVGGASLTSNAFNNALQDIKIAAEI